ncbi:unnamed protein product [Urochloa decumbens]|uniref:Uncharacterized protein n=1 Tax=Urochloa decumbens TaxID=240449 RepID=A0ABC9FLM9_9POAL
MAEIVGSVLVQEGLSKALSFIMGKREEKASEGLSAERLEMAVSEMEFALERTMKLPVTDVSLLHRRKMIRRAYLEGIELLNKHKSHALQVQEEIGQGSKRKRWFISRAKNNLSFSSSFSGLKMDDVRRFEWFADHAGKFVRDVESGCSLRHYTFCSPHVRHLLEGKTLRYEVLQGSRLLRRLYMQPICFEGRGVETVLIYQYRDSKIPERSFNLVLILRLSESTDIAEIAVKCLRSMASQFKLVTEAAIGELTLLPNLQYIVHSHARCYAEIDLESYNNDSQYLRPDPICCKENGQGPCANGVFPEEVIHFFFRCSVSAQDCSSSDSSDGPGRRRAVAMRDWRAPLNLTVGCMPHHVYNSEQQLQESYTLEIFGDDEERGDVSIHKGGEMLRSKATDFFLRKPELTEYRMLWISKHVVVGFFMEKPASSKRACAPKTTGRISSRMAVACHLSMSLQQRSIKQKGTEEPEHGHKCPFRPWAV